MQFTSLNLNNAQAITNRYFSYYSNGGYGKLPNPSSDDQRTTDQFVARRVNYPTFKTQQYYKDYRSPNNIHNTNREVTFTQTISQLQGKGISIVGQEGNGKYRLYASVPDSSGYIKSYSQEDDLSQFLWILFGIGFLAFVVNAMTPP